MSEAPPRRRVPSTNTASVVAITIVRTRSAKSSSMSEKPRWRAMGPDALIVRRVRLRRCRAGQLGGVAGKGARQPGIHSRPHEAPLRPFADRLSARRRRPHRDLQPPPRAPARRHDAAAHRRHRRRALATASRRADRQLAPVAGHRLGRRADLPERPARAISRARRGARRGGQGLSLLLHGRGAGGRARRRRERAGKAYRYLGQVPRHRETGSGVARHAARHPIQASRQGRSTFTTSSAATSTSKPISSTTSSCCAPTAIRRITSPSSSTTSTWTSRTSRAATIICRTRRSTSCCSAPSARRADLRTPPADPRQRPEAPQQTHRRHLGRGVSRDGASFRRRSSTS